jgi:uncharacterized protein HemY
LRQAIEFCESAIEESTGSARKNAMQMRLHYLLVRSSQFEKADDVYKRISAETKKPQFLLDMRQAESFLHRGNSNDATELIAVHVPPKEKGVTKSGYFDLLIGIVAMAEGDLVTAERHLTAAFGSLKNPSVAFRATEGTGIRKLFSKFENQLKSNPDWDGKWDDWREIRSNFNQ